MLQGKRGIVLFAIGVLVCLPLGIFGVLVAAMTANGVSLTGSPGTAARLHRYLTRNWVDTTEPSFFPEAAPIEIQASTGETWNGVQTAVGRLGWEVVESDPERLILHAVDRTPVWGFVDDIRIEVHDRGTRSSIIHIRSESRVGRGDLGANLGRILRFSREIRGEFEPSRR